MIGQQDELRATAVAAFGNVAKQCSDPDAVCKLIDILTGVLYGMRLFHSMCCITWQISIIAEVSVLLLYSMLPFSSNIE